MLRAFHLSAAALLFTVALSARADISPPEQGKITLELTVDGQASMPLLRFFVTNCREPVEKSVLEPVAPLVCEPKSGPLRVYGFREGDLVELFDMIRRNASTQESAAFLARKGKTCGEVAEQDRTFLAKTGVSLVEAHYKIEPGPKAGCKLTRVSATTKTRAELQARGNAAPAPSTTPAASSPAPAPAPAPTPAPPVAKSDCACRSGPLRSSSAAPLALAVALLASAWLRARLGRRNAPLASTLRERCWGERRRFRSPGA